MRKDRTPTVLVDEHEYQRLLGVYKQRTDPNRRAPERVERPIAITPSVAGGRIVSWAEYLDLVERGAAHYPPAHIHGKLAA